MKGDEEPLVGRRERRRRKQRKKLAQEMRKTWESVHGRDVTKHSKTPWIIRR